ncbi:hypothetical protein ARMGADRAFT_347491 [Armillaria gallica]|uniref:Uncharacterized protein n=1 Tax=Armillaria gallica TaxID=47427 RepID=A0A2H3D4E0_ARMGA|nr:hypothetical protein ARMGADRAFT_347491 [Armillaria gallica]
MRLCENMLRSSFGRNFVVSASPLHNLRSIMGGWTGYSSSASLYPASTSSNCGLWNLERDCTSAAAMQDAFGFTAAQVLSMSKALGIEK